MEVCKSWRKIGILNAFLGGYFAKWIAVIGSLLASNSFLIMPKQYSPRSWKLKNRRLRIVNRKSRRYETTKQNCSIRKGGIQKEWWLRCVSNVICILYLLINICEFNYVSVTPSKRRLVWPQISDGVRSSICSLVMNRLNRSRYGNKLFQEF